MMLNVSNKIVAKASRRRLKPLLFDIIDEDQTGFLSLHYILDNILVQTETIEWRKELAQDLILLKLDFKKAFDTVSLHFLFSILQELGFPVNFVNYVKLLFNGAEVTVCLNGA